MDKLLYGVEDEVLDVLRPLCNLYGTALAAEQQQAVLAPEDVLQTVQQAVAECVE